MRTFRSVACSIATFLLATVAVAHDESGNRAKSGLAPGIEFFVDGAYHAAPPLAFEIEQLTSVERHVYVEADAEQRIERAVIVQFERAQDESELRFVYPPIPAERFGRHDFRFGAFAFDEAIAAARNPEREAGRTRAHLEQQGYVLPRYWRVARLARVADGEGRSEVIVFYLENADDEYGAAGLKGADEDGDLALPAEEAELLLRRLRAAIAVVAD